MDAILLKCPFCAGDPVEDIIPEAWGYYPERTRIFCDACKVSTPFFNQEQYNNSHHERAKAAWNKRPEVTCSSRYSYDDTEHNAFMAGFKAGVKELDGVFVEPRRND